jgi:hypothetical protein
MTFGAANLSAFSPFSSGLTGSLNGQSLFGFFGGDANYKIVDADGTLDTGLGFTNRGLSVSFKLINVNTGEYNMRVIELVGNVIHDYNGRHVNGGIDSIGLYNYNAQNNDAFFNSVSIIPAPGTLALLGIGGLIVARRRR